MSVCHGCLQALARLEGSTPHQNMTRCVVNPLQRGYKVRAMTRSKDKADQLLGNKNGLEVIVADAKDPQTLPASMQGIDAVAAVTGTTAFPSKK